MPLIVKGEGHKIWDSHGREYIDGLAGLFVVQVGHGREELAEAAAKQAKELAFFPLWSFAHPRAVELADRIAAMAPGDLNRVFFTTGGGEAVESAWKLAKQYFKLTGKPNKHKVISRAVAYHGTPQGALSITGIPPLKEMFEPLVPGRPQGAEHQLLPPPRLHRRRREGVRPLGRGPDRGGDRVRGPRHGRRRVPRAGAERRRLLPAAARLLRAGPRDLRRVRRPAGVGRGHLRLRPGGGDVRCDRVRLPARHHHLRQGHDLGLLADRRDDRERPAVRAVQDGHNAYAHGYTFGGHPVSSAVGDGQPRHLRARGPGRPRPAERARRSGRRWRSCSTSRSSATSAATATSTASSWSRTARPRRRSTTPSPSGCCAATSPARCGRPASTAVPTTAATRSSSSRRRSSSASPSSTTSSSGSAPC